MKRLLTILLFFPLLCSAQTFNAFTATVDGGFAAEKMGGTGGLSIGYGLRHKHLVMRVGVGVGYDYLQYGVADREEIEPAVDSEQIDYKKHSVYTEGSAQLHRLEAQVPVLIGAEWEHIYFLVGATPALSVWEQRTTKGLVTTSGEYDMFDDLFVQMPNHHYGPNPYSEQQRVTPMAFNLYASAEIGTPIGERLRIGAFADYGVFSTGEATRYRVGARLTVWLGREYHKHYPCRCLKE